MRYQFPIIKDLSEVRSVIDGVDGFILAEREWGWVANYLQMGTETFPEVNSVSDAIRRECRGLIFSPEGRLISRPYHKFFNVNERDETQVNRIDLSQPHVILEKLDGSMVRPIPIGKAYRLGTKMGVTDVSMQAEVWLASNPDYDAFVRECLINEVTPIFEWVSRKQRIVIDYPVDRMVLTAVRSNYTGLYVDMPTLRDMASSYNVNVVNEYRGSVDSMEQLLAETHDLTGQEGWVIRFLDGHMLKLKGSEYVAIHKAKDRLLRENGVIDMILDEQMDDVKAALPSEDRHVLEEFERNFWHGLVATSSTWEREYRKVKNIFGDDRKAFALQSAQTLEQNLRGAIFKAWDNSAFNFQNAVIDAVKKNLGTQTKVNDARHLWGGVEWKYRNDAGE